MACVVGATSLLLGVTGCVAPTPEKSCETSIAEVEPIPHHEGLDYVTSSELAATLLQCEDVRDWIDAFTAHPEVVELEVITSEDAEIYLASSCQLLPGKGGGSPVCEEAKQMGLYS